MSSDDLAVLRALVKKIHDLEVRRADMLRNFLEKLLDCVPIIIPLDDE